MTDMYNEFRLGSDAVEYIKSRLANGKTLARCLLKQHDLGNGEVVTLLPPNADPERMKNFSGGGVLPTPPPETHQHYKTSDGIKTVLVPVPNTATRMVEMIREFLKEGEGRICIFESA